VETLGSTPGEEVIVPKPRISSEVSLFEDPVRKSAEGIREVMAPKLFKLDCSNSVPSSTETAMGTDCRGSARRVAVTVTVSNVATPSLLDGVVLVCAWAGSAANAEMTDKVIKDGCPNCPICRNWPRDRLILRLLMISPAFQVVAG
jgi:hypothetical protein